MTGFERIDSVGTSDEDSSEEEEAPKTRCKGCNGRLRILSLDTALEYEDLDEDTGEVEVECDDDDHETVLRKVVCWDSWKGVSQQKSHLCGYVEVDGFVVPAEPKAEKAVLKLFKDSSRELDHLVKAIHRREKRLLKKLRIHVVTDNQKDVLEAEAAVNAQEEGSR